MKDRQQKLKTLSEQYTQAVNKTPIFQLNWDLKKIKNCRFQWQWKPSRQALDSHNSMAYSNGQDKMPTKPASAEKRSQMHRG